MKENHLYTGKISNKKIFYIETYGCQMNVADSELIKNIMNVIIKISIVLF